MDSLNTKIDQLKKRIKDREDEDKELRIKINTVLSAVFCDVGLGSDSLANFYLKNGNLYLIAKSKVIANELFLRKDQIEKNLEGDKKIKKILIK